MNNVIEQPIVVPTLEEMEKDPKKWIQDIEHLSRDLERCNKAFERYKEKVKARQEGRWPW